MAWIEEYQTSKGRHYRIGWCEGGKRRYESAGAYKPLAIKKKEDIEKRLLGGASLIEKSVQGCFDEYLQVAEKTKKPRTQKIINYALKPFLSRYGSLPVQRMNPQELERFKNSLLPTRKINGINIIIRNIKSFFSFAMVSGYINVSPARNLRQFKPEKVARFLTRKELARLLWNGSKRFRKAVLSLAYTGMRLGELLSLDEADVKRGHATIKETKTGRSRIIPIRKKVMPYLLATIRQPYDLDAFEKSFKLASKGMGRIRTHDLRHTFASAYLQSGGTVSDLKEITGHKSSASLDIYTHFQKSYLSERINQVRI